MIRILVCGTRTWLDGAPIYDELMIVCGHLGIRDCSELTIVHGACPTGADKIANDWATEAGAKIERWPADWNAFGKSAGPRRNEQMAEAGADLCLAFWDGESRGTLDMITRAVKHGIPVRIVPMRRVK